MGYSLFRRGSFVPEAAGYTAFLVHDRADQHADITAELMSDFEGIFLGKWKSAAGQRISIRRAFMYGLVANYYPTKGRPRFFLPALIYERALLVPLTFGGVLGTTLELSLASELATRKEILVPQLQFGTETEWWEEDYGVAWALPLAVFRKN